jgi:hypothetical protein
LNGNRVFRADAHTTNDYAAGGISFFHWVLFLVNMIYTIVNQIGLSCNRR